jgi:hypothetical protein
MWIKSIQRVEGIQEFSKRMEQINWKFQKELNKELVRESAVYHRYYRSFLIRRRFRV